MLEQIVIDMPWYKKLSVLRISKDWSQQEAAEKCFTSQKTFWLWEKGEAYPRKNSQRAIASAFGVSVSEIFKEKMNKRGKGIL